MGKSESAIGEDARQNRVNLPLAWTDGGRRKAGRAGVHCRMSETERERDSHRAHVEEHHDTVESWRGTWRSRRQA